MLEENKKNYYAIIPANVRYDINLCPNAKLLYGEITALCNEKGFCWASNKYFADLYSVSPISVSRWISLLEQLGYIKVELIYKENSKEIQCRHIRIVNNFDIVPNNTTGGSNNKSNNTKEKYTDEIKEIIDFLNEKTNSRYRYNTESTNKLIRSKLNNGFTVNDFKYIISNKTNEWVGTDFEQYLRPSTLFGNKFEQYLNQSPYKTKFSSLNISQQAVSTTQNNNTTNEEKYLTNDDGNLIVF